jgi:hypothetical protein
MHAHENSAKKQRKHSKQNCESADSGTDFTAGLDDKLAYGEKLNKREKNFKYKQVNTSSPSCL